VPFNHRICIGGSSLPIGITRLAGISISLSPILISTLFGRMNVPSLIFLISPIRPALIP